MHARRENGVDTQGARALLAPLRAEAANAPALARLELGCVLRARDHAGLYTRPAPPATRLPPAHCACYPRERPCTAVLLAPALCQPAP